MRCLSVASKLVASAVPPAALAFVWCSPASAHVHHYSYRHSRAHTVHYGGRHLYAMDTNNVASGAGFSSQYFASPYSGPSGFNGSSYARSAGYDNVSSMAASQAGTAGLPASLVERVIRRESGGNPRAVHAGKCRSGSGPHAPWAIPVRLRGCSIRRPT
jgi:soluble lytic murein transglycosylase-like protein